MTLVDGYGDFLMDVTSQPIIMERHKSFTTNFMAQGKYPVMSHDEFLITLMELITFPDLSLIRHMRTLIASAVYRALNMSQKNRDCQWARLEKEYLRIPFMVSLIVCLTVQRETYIDARGGHIKY
ncbi:hypothetical protein TNCV_2401021 [Trichonephila clavipes]|nr:hypothetical protein TNCV_2401021 [Trichonephila clavipes]